MPTAAPESDSQTDILPLQSEYTKSAVLEIKRSDESSEVEFANAFAGELRNDPIGFGATSSSESAGGTLRALTPGLRTRTGSAAPRKESAAIHRFERSFDGELRSSISADGAGVTAIDRAPLDRAQSEFVYAACKRLIDIVGSAVLIVLFFPVFLLVVILTKLTDGGPVFYPHKRVGERGREFHCYKFRSMVVGAENLKSELIFHNTHQDSRTFKIPNDPRVTWVGRWMRRTSIDEFPQLWNVLMGDMSLVGPRPSLASEVELYSEHDKRRLWVKPGLTCIWQVSGRSRLPFPEQLKMDLEYIEKRSLLLDLKLIAMTIPAVLSGDGAY